MKFEMAPNSLFAVLLRSPWWISLALAAGFVAIARALLPAEYFALGAFGSAPLLVIACVAGWRQLRAPSPGRVAESLAAIRAMPWSAFASAIEDAFRRDGHAIAAHPRPAADYALTKNGRVALLACKRWKAARTGVEPLRELRAEQDRCQADECIYVVAGELTDTAQAFATANGVRLLRGAELAGLLAGVRLPSAHASRAGQG